MYEVSVVLQLPIFEFTDFFLIAFYLSFFAIYVLSQLRFCVLSPSRCPFPAAVNEVTKVRVNCKNAGKGELTASVLDEGKNTLYPVALKEIGDDTYEIAYSVPNTGTYEFTIKYDDIHITGSPFVVKGYSRTHPEQIGIYNLFVCLLVYQCIYCLLFVHFMQKSNFVIIVNWSISC